ncbi:hypothetical protein GGS23DRAFT_119731 [Durotheca rogersii]|uniref:uncharacterized protein n=1 Tax=Durotheca rogersii TaxID=419775 RepID=UPI00221EFBEA|nr:uncharacterized protein GGS23DRAFT_119731 [Durotheca rogersii]KAI5861934.1 hypothetical protein GGS23DRAFT_119731 [Durotheca rogersii]
MSKADESGGEVGPLANDVLLVFTPVAEQTEWIKRVTNRFEGLRVRWVNSLKADGTILTAREVPAEVWDGVTILTTFVPPPEDLVAKVRLIQVSSAGTDRWTNHPKYLDENTIFCTSNGIHAPQIAEWVIGAWLSHQHHFQRYAAHMKTGYWESPFATHIEDSTGLRVGILGYGAIGRACASIARTLGMEVYAYTRGERATPESRVDDSYCVAGTGDREGLIPTRWFHGTTQAAVDEFLAQDLDLLVLSLPLTPETRGILSRAQFEILGKGKKAFVANVARGGHIDQDALIEALESGKIRGAALDVTDPEPLPSDHPLWRAPNLLITPHVSWKTDFLWNRLLDVLEINLEKLATGQPLINVVNRQLHY